MATLEELQAKQAEIAKKIMEIDKDSSKSEELNKLRSEHEEITVQIEDLPNADELKHAA